MFIYHSLVDMTYLQLDTPMKKTVIRIQFFDNPPFS